MRCTGSSLASGAPSPPQTVCLLARTRESQTPPPASALFGLRPSVDAGRPDKCWVNRERERIPARLENDFGKSHEEKRPNTLGRPWNLIRVPSSDFCQFECTSPRDHVSAWGVAYILKPKTLSLELAASSETETALISRPEVSLLSISCPQHRLGVDARVQ
jgi:hypothetical protein